MAGRMTKAGRNAPFGPLAPTLSGNPSMHAAAQRQLRLKDRDRLEELRVALNGALNALKRDECGDFALRGRRGHIHAVDGRFYIFVAAGSPKAWTYAKKALLPLCSISQDGDEEGILILDRMPTIEEAETIRAYIGLMQTRDSPPNAFSPA
jgi:hypothetical protein